MYSSSFLQGILKLQSVLLLFYCSYFLSIINCLSEYSDIEVFFLCMYSIVLHAISCGTVIVFSLSLAICYSVTMVMSQSSWTWAVLHLPSASLLTGNYLFPSACILMNCLLVRVVFLCIVWLLYQLYLYTDCCRREALALQDYCAQTCTAHYRYIYLGSTI